MRVQINLRISKNRREFFDAIGGAAFGEFVCKIFRVIVGKLHSMNEFLACHFEAGPGDNASRLPLENISGHCRKGNRNRSRSEGEPLRPSAEVKRAGQPVGRLQRIGSYVYGMGVCPRSCQPPPGIFGYQLQNGQLTSLPGSPYTNYSAPDMVIY